MFVTSWIAFGVILGSISTTLSKPDIEPISTECGRTTPRLQPMVVGGTTAGRGELPWHAAVYQRTSSPYKLICGGSIVSRNVVLSAAHCFWDLYFNVKFPASNFAVAAGKIYRPWREKEPSAQFSFVEELIIPDSFRGEDRNLADDIALVILTQPFEFKPYLRPVCLEFDNALEETQLTDGNLGKIAGWGLISRAGDLSSLLRTVELPYMDINSCLRKTPSSYWEVLSNDKFCAGYTNGDTALCKGDSGGGLVFPSTDPRGVTRYYLRGIVSSSPSNDTKCNTYAVTTFTKVSRYGSFIRQRVPGKPVPTQNRPAPTGSCILPPYPDNGRYTVEGSPDAVPGAGLHAAIITVTCDSGYQISGDPSVFCTGGAWKSTIATCYDCGRVTPQYEALIVNGTRAKLNRIPWHAGLYKKETNGTFNQLCGATIISTKLVITAAHCIWDHNGDVQKPASDFAVAAGKIFRNWSKHEPTAQYSDVSEIEVPRRFLGVSTNLAEDIAVLTLAVSLQFRPYLRPVCLDFGKRFENEQLRTGNKGTVAGWGFTDPDEGKPSQQLLFAELPYKDFQTCLQETPKEFRSFYTPDKICVGINGTSLCLGDSGGGLAFPTTGSDGIVRYYLRGVASTGPRHDAKLCNTNANTYYTKISRHYDLLESYLNKRTSGLTVDT